MVTSFLCETKKSMNQEILLARNYNDVISETIISQFCHAN